MADAERADLLTDDGKFDEAMQLYDAALAKAADHPLALVGKALARAERGANASEVVQGINVKLDEDLGARVNGYRHLALAMAYYNLDEPQRFSESLARAVGTREPRFLARVALARALQAASATRRDLAWQGDVVHHRQGRSGSAGHAGQRRAAARRRHARGGARHADQARRHPRRGAARPGADRSARVPTRRPRPSWPRREHAPESEESQCGGSGPGAGVDRRSPGHRHRRARRRRASPRARSAVTPTA